MKPKATRIRLAAAAVSVAVVAACGTAEFEGGIRLTTTTTTSVETPDIEIRPLDGGVVNPGAVNATFLDELLADAVELSGDSRATVRLAEVVVWNDGALGCPEEGVMYTQAEVEGFRVVIETEHQDLYYHSAGIEHYVVCDNLARSDLSHI